MATYALTVSTNALGLGVISSATVVVERKRTTVTDIYPTSSLYIKKAATNVSGIATIQLEADDGTVFHEIKIFDASGVLVYKNTIQMPPQAADIEDLPLNDIITESAQQAVEAASQTALDVVATAADAAATAADAAATAADRVQTGLDVIATGNSAAAALVSETNALAYKTAIEGDNGVYLANEKENELILLSQKSKLGCAITRIGNTYNVMRHLQDNIWLEQTMSNSGTLASGIYTPFKITSQIVRKLFGFQSSRAAVKVGTWTEYVSADSTPYVGHTSYVSNTNGNTLTFTATFAGIPVLSFTGAVDGGISNVSVDGGAAVAVDMYSAGGNTWKREAALTTEPLAHGTHTIVVTVTNTKNASSSGYRCWVGALKVQDNSILPNSPLIPVSAWKPSKVYGVYTECVNSNGRYYVTVAGGTSGATEPTHVSGTVSDGGVSWLAVLTTSFSAEDFRIQSAGSELEYAYKIKPTGETVAEDCGGNLHGNEYMTALPVVKVAMTVVTDTELNNKIFLADSIEISQNITQYYGTYGAGHYTMATNKQVHSFFGQATEVYYKLTWAVNANVGYFYSAMWPFLVYDGPNSRKQFKRMYTPQFDVDLADYSGVAGNPIVGLKKDYIMCAEGRAFQPSGEAGVPVTGDGQGGVIIGLRVTKDSVNGYLDADKNAGIAVNGNAGQYTGYSSWLGKMYFQRYKDNQVTAVTAGDSFEARNRYYVVLTGNAVTFL